MANENPNNFPDLASTLNTLTSMESDQFKPANKPDSKSSLVMDEVGNQLQQKPNQIPKTIEEKVFGGKIQVAYQCNNCR